MATNFSSSPVDNIPTQVPEAQPWGDVYTMPQNFQPQVMPNQKKGGHIWWWVSGIIILVLVGGAGVYLLLTNKPNTVTNTPVDSNTSTTPAPEQPPAPLPEPQTTPEERDRMRYLHITNLNKGILDYFAVQKKYPIALLPLILGTETTSVLSSAGFSGTAIDTTYLSPVPANPAPGGADYIYFSADGSTYSLKFILEQGAAGFAAGEHELTPRGIDVVLLPPPAPTPLAPRTIQLPTLTIDTDQDGLTDAEESLLKLDINKPDTDDDGYVDGLEIQNLYDPLRPGTARLDASSELATYTNQRFGYATRYPATWSARTDQNESEVLLMPEEGDFFEVLIVDNPEHLTVSDWYARQVPGLKSEEVPTQNINDLIWAMSLDGLSTYAATDRYIITFSYNIGGRVQASYYNLFKSLLKLFTFVSPN